MEKILATILSLTTMFCITTSDVFALEDDLHVNCTQFQIKEQCYLYYHRTYCKKSINKNIQAYKNSVSNTNLINRLVCGDWSYPIGL